jgi:outer membrane protein assembly factor BamB
MKYLSYNILGIFSLIVFCTTLSYGQSKNDTSLIKLLWVAPLDEDTLDCGSITPIIWNNNVGFLKKFGNEKEIFKWRDGKNGKKIWAWQDKSNQITGELIGSMAQQDNLLSICSWREINVIDLNTGQNLWRSDTKDRQGKGFPRTKIIGNHIYHANFKESGTTFSDVVHLVRSPLTQSKWDTILSIKQSEHKGYCPFIEMPTLQINQNGDSVLIFQNRQVHDITTLGKVDVYAFNLKTKKYDWKIDSIENNSSIHPPTIYDNKIYFMGGNNLYCINPDNGKIIWKWNIPNNDNLLGDNILIAENKIYIKTPNLSMYCLDPLNGTLIWKNDMVGASSYCGIRYYKGYVFCTGSAIIGLDAKTGVQKIKVLAPKHKYHNKNLTIGWGLEIDEKNNLLYCADNKYALCFKLKL